MMLQLIKTNQNETTSTTPRQSEPFHLWRLHLPFGELSVRAVPRFVYSSQYCVFQGVL